MIVTLVDKDIAPHGSKCLICHKIARPGQWVLFHTIPDYMHVVLHKQCMVTKAEEMPEDIAWDLQDEFIRIQNDYKEGKVFDDDVNG